MAAFLLPSNTHEEETVKGLWLTVAQVTSERTLIVPVRRVYQDRPGRGVASFTAQANATFRSIKYYR